MATEAAAAQVILNAAPAPEEGKRWREGQWEDVGAMLRAADVLCVNETEAEKLAGLPVAGRAGAELDAAVAAAADRLHAMVRGARSRRKPPLARVRLVPGRRRPPRSRGGRVQGIDLRIGRAAES